MHLLTHTGEQEKCVDISLAVEMLHYATIADSYDLAVLITVRTYAHACARIRTHIHASVRIPCRRP